MRQRRIACFLAAAVLAAGLSACTPSNPLGDDPVSDSRPASTVPQPVGVWRGTGSFTDSYLILRENGTGAILSHMEEDGGAFPEDFFLGTEVTWEAAGGQVFLDPRPVTLPGGAIYTPELPPVRRAYTVDGELLTLSDGDLTEVYTSAEEPRWFTPAEYATALADWLIGEQAENAQALYEEFYRQFAEAADE